MRRKLLDFFKKLFFLKRSSDISLGIVRDTVKFTESGDSITLTVCADPQRLVQGLSKARELMMLVTDDTPKEEQITAAKFIATVIFGSDQAEKLMNFYFGEPACVINVCGKYFAEKLSGLIVKEQKKHAASK
jgi:hypothetical protein